MRRIASTALAAVTLAAAWVPALAVATSGTAAAASEPTVLPFSQKLRRCDFSELQYAGASHYGRTTGVLRVEGNEVIADIQLATGTPNSRYDVKLIQVPRSSALSCNGGDPGVAAAPLNTDVAGAGATTVRGPIASDSTGVWLSVTRPGPYSQVPDEFYTTDAVFGI